jgi:GntR family transcriptional regulator
MQQTERFVLTGVLRRDDPLPSVRRLSETLSANANTIQKAYTELDRRGITYSVPGKGIFISEGASDIIKRGRVTELKAIEHSAHECALAEIPIEAALEAVRRGYSAEKAGGGTVPQPAANNDTEGTEI